MKVIAFAGSNSKNSINKKLYNKSKYKRLDSLLEERERKIKIC